MLETDGAARLAAIAIGNLELAPFARLDHFVQACNLGITTALRSVLNDYSVSLLCLHRDSSFNHVVAHGFLHVDVFACLCPPDGHQGMPMVGSGDGNRIDRGVVKSLTNVEDTLAFVGAIHFLVHGLHRRGAYAFVDICQIGDFDIFRTEPSTDVIAAATV